MGVTSDLLLHLELVMRPFTATMIHSCVVGNEDRDIHLVFGHFSAFTWRKARHVLTS